MPITYEYCTILRVLIHQSYFIALCSVSLNHSNCWWCSAEISIFLIFDCCSHHQLRYSDIEMLIISASTFWARRNWKIFAQFSISFTEISSLIIWIRRYRFIWPMAKSLPGLIMCRLRHSKKRLNEIILIMWLEMTGDFCDPLTLNIKSENCDATDYVPARPGEKRKRGPVPRVRDVTKVRLIQKLKKKKSWDTNKTKKKLKTKKIHQI